MLSMLPWIKILLSHSGGLSACTSYRRIAKDLKAGQKNGVYDKIANLRSRRRIAKQNISMQDKPSEWDRMYPGNREIPTPVFKLARNDWHIEITGKKVSNLNGTIISSWSAVGEKLYSGVNPQAVAEEIMGIGTEATPKQVVERARNQDSELHKCFDWDDSSAAEKYRLVQARSVMTNIVIKRTPEQKERNAPEIRVFYKTETGHGYKAAPIVFHKTDEYQSLLKRAVSELRAFELKYKKLSELQEIFELIPMIGGETN